MGEPVTQSRLDSLTSWHADWSQLRVLVLGLGVSGFAAADTLAELGAAVTVAARAPDADRARILPVIGVSLVDLVDDDADALPALAALDPELIIVSPGFRPDHVVINWARDQGIPMWGDIELAWRVRDKGGSPAEWVLVTGTNGKTTTTRLTAEMLRANGTRVAPCGNIGVPVLDAVRDPLGFDVLVVELSSFQLHQLPTEGPGAVHPLASVCLNLAEDHYDWHGGRDAYRDAKAKVYANTVGACVYNRSDSATVRMVEEADVAEGARAIGFGPDAPGPSDLGLVDDILVDRAFLEDRARSALEIGTLDDVRAAGLANPHGLANVLAAAALARAAGASPKAVRDGIRAFRVDPHRTELVLEAHGVSWIDDSKATNPHAANAALSSFPSVVWIVGGLLKGIELDTLIGNHRHRLRAAIVIGLDRDAVVRAFERHAPDVPVIVVEADDTERVMLDAVSSARSVAREGDTVVLAPAAASFDQFTDYADRGRRFHAAVLDQHDTE
jgi:UDP-N-acetylmuramoylalanine--D-glutamate ligase